MSKDLSTRHNIIREMNSYSHFKKLSAASRYFHNDKNYPTTPVDRKYWGLIQGGNIFSDYPLQSPPITTRKMCFSKYNIRVEFLKLNLKYS